MVLKSDKSGRMIAKRKEEYVKMGRKSNSKDKKLSRKEVQNIERDINDHTIMLCKIFNARENHDHLSRIIKLKVVES